MELRARIRVPVMRSAVQVFDALRLILQHVQACLLLGCYLVLFEQYALPIILRMWLSSIMHLSLFYSGVILHVLVSTRCCAHLLDFPMRSSVLAWAAAQSFSSYLALACNTVCVSVAQSSRRRRSATRFCCCTLVVRFALIGGFAR